MTTSRPKRVFLTFSTSDWVGTRTRLYFRALECGWFDEVVTKDESVVPDEYKERLKEPFHGFYFWKPIAIYKELERLEYGDILVYADAGSDINLNGWYYFEEKMNLLSSHDVLVYGLTFLRQFCNPEILDDFGISIEEAQKTAAAQAGLIYIRKTSASMSLISEWMDYVLKFPDQIRYEFDRDGDIDGYVQNRGDQSVFGCVCWKHKRIVNLMKPCYDWAIIPRNMSGLDLRSASCDIVLTRKKFNYKPYVMFVIGHALPFFEKKYDEYTHFINVGNDNLHRCWDTTGDNIHQYSGAAEHTGIYWIWKNVDLSNVKYIGISTHRKPFAARNEFMYKKMEEGATAIANEYYQNRKSTLLTAFDESLFNDIVEIFGKHHPEYKEDFIKHETCGTLFPSNSFVVRTEDFYKMCEFVLPVTLEVAKKYEGFVGNDTVSRFPHAVPAGCFGEDFISFYIMKFLGQKIVPVPFVIYPKEIELFRAEVSPFGMVFGRMGDEFYPYGLMPRSPAVIRTPNQYSDNGEFYPPYSHHSETPFVIKSKSISLKR